jgi:hypothetical protein
MGEGEDSREAKLSFATSVIEIERKELAEAPKGKKGRTAGAAGRPSSVLPPPSLRSRGRSLLRLLQVWEEGREQ